MPRCPCRAATLLPANAHAPCSPSPCHVRPQQARKQLHCHSLLFCLRNTNALARALDGDTEAGNALAAYIDSFLTATFVSFDPDMECNPALCQHNATYIQQLPLPSYLYCHMRHPVADPPYVAPPLRCVAGTRARAA